jgi:hypothetical protein
LARAASSPDFGDFDVSLKERPHTFIAPGADGRLADHEDRIRLMAA